VPQSAILGVGRINPLPAVVDGRVEVRDCVTLSLTFDHRVADGATAAALLTSICELVESPIATLIA
jgi:pyruvate dehydrogenase E2 component (dihydrolipoamide acetyltransferase)